MKTFDEKFHDLIDITNGQVRINETVYKQIQTDALFHAAQLCVKEFVGTNDGFVAKHACEKAILAAAPKV